MRARVMATGYGGARGVDTWRGEPAWWAGRLSVNAGDIWSLKGYRFDGSNAFCR